MVMPQRHFRIPPLQALLNLSLAIIATAVTGSTVFSADTDRVTQANYKQAFHFSSEFLRQFV